MVALIGQVVESYEEELYSAVRIFVGLLFMQHGVQKLFGLFGGVDGSGGTVSLVSLYGVAGILELVGGFLIAVGMLTRLVALLTAGEMIAAQFMTHIPDGLIPIQNGGELGLLYLAVFLVLIVCGSGQYSIEHLLFDREVV
ncbi:DoxX family protein [Natrinema sp. 74]|uniref:DoxX family protein n=1 Tax=Natrinema sp. 74 TaxID=3384159 RepID=UPI0038D41C7F